MKTTMRLFVQESSLAVSCCWSSLDKDSPVVKLRMCLESFVQPLRWVIPEHLWVWNISSCLVAQVCCCQLAILSPFLIVHGPVVSLAMRNVTRAMIFVWAWKTSGFAWKPQVSSGKTDSGASENVRDVQSVRKTSSWCGKSWHVSLVVNRKNWVCFTDAVLPSFFCRHTDILACCELRAEVSIRDFDQLPKGFISRCPWSTGFVRSSTPNISNTKLDSFLCSASWLRVTQELYLLCVLCSFFVRLLTVRHFVYTKWFCEHQLQYLIAQKTCKSSSHQKSNSFWMKPTRLRRFTFQPHWRCFSIIVPQASKYFQSCLPFGCHEYHFQG